MDYDLQIYGHSNTNMDIDRIEHITRQAHLCRKIFKDKFGEIIHESDMN